MAGRVSQLLELGRYLGEFVRVEGNLGIRGGDLQAGQVGG